LESRFDWYDYIRWITKELKEYIDFIEKKRSPYQIVSVGPDRTQTITK
jgi:adenylosuccinate synthase